MKPDDRPSWLASVPRLLWFMQGVAWAGILVVAANAEGKALAMVTALLVATLPSSTLQAWRMGKDLARQARKKGAQV